MEMSIVQEMLEKLFRTPRVLLVDNQQSGESRVEFLLRRMYDCEIERMGKESDRPYDIIFVDLPDTDVTMLRFLRKKGAPIVMISFHGEEDLQHAGAITVLSKPVTEHTIEEVFRLFKIKARTPDVRDYLQNAAPSTETASCKSSAL